jgi:SAM-dependent methyltransferase
VGLTERDPEAWDREAATFDDEPDHGLRDRATRQAWRALLLEHLPPAPARVADLGCGTGTLALLLAEEGYEVDGVDFSPEMVAAAQRKAGDGLPLRFALGDASAPPLPAGTFDVVLSRHVLWALPDPSEALARWISLLRPGGRLLLVEGDWSTGAGLAADRTEALVREHRDSVSVRHLPDPLLWGGPISDERYLVLSLG